MVKCNEGEVVLLPPSMKVPHMGWNELGYKKIR